MTSGHKLVWGWLRLLLGLAQMCLAAAGFILLITVGVQPPLSKRNRLRKAGRISFRTSAGALAFAAKQPPLEIKRHIYQADQRRHFD
jgi:hypothetical protein